ncbi:unnamed protein product, partial [Didymodactylos carnosus]
MLRSICNRKWLQTHEESKKLGRDYEKERQDAADELEVHQHTYNTHNDDYLSLVIRATSIEDEIKSLENMLSLHLEDQHNKLRVKAVARGTLARQTDARETFARWPLARGGHLPAEDTC